MRETKAQVRPVYDYGATGLAQILKRLNTTASVMHIGAHPDDEDSGLLAFLARGENARTAYLSLTRGDGGQNIIGSELGESLGVIRTEELLQARRLDGAEQYFTRAFDFGFSKTLAEAKEKWDEKVILCDAVRAIRAFRPLVVISRFSGTTADGHGQHQFAGYIAPLAVKAAADATQCTNAGAAWQVLKFYVSQGFRSTNEPTLRINTGKYDALLGRSYFEIAMEGRSQHKTQEQGGLELKGEQFSGLNLIESKVPKPEKEMSVFDGIEVSLANAPKTFVEDEKAVSEAAKTLFTKIHQSAERALKEYEPNNPQKIIPILIEGERAAYQLNWRYVYAYGVTDISGSEYSAKTREELDERIRNEGRLSSIAYTKWREFTEAIKFSSGIRIDALADKETIVPGEDLSATVKVFLPNAENVKVKEITLNAPKGWTVEKVSAPKDASQNPFRRETANQTGYFSVKAANSVKPTEPYWLENPRDGSLYRWNADANQNLPLQPPIVTADVKIEVDGAEITINQPVQFRFADDVRGEIRRDLNVVPKVSLNLDQNLLIVPQSEKPQMRKIVLSVTNNSASAVSGEAKLNLPEGWASAKYTEKMFTRLSGLSTSYKFEKIDSISIPYQLAKKGEKISIAFNVTIPVNVKIGDFDINAQATANSETFTQTMNEIAYPHIQTHRFYTRAETKVTVLDLKTASAKIGYIMGSGDAVPEAIRRMNLPVALLSETDLTSGDLSRFDTIVAGIRAFQVRQDLISNNRRILDFVASGGNFIVQYQRPDYASQNLPPFPASMTDTQKTTAGSTARVVDENAKVTILQPAHPVFNFPNKITDEDFKDWVQERNLYNFVNFDAKYTPLLESHDAGETANQGGMVYAEIGKGKYIYTSYSFFRQLPAGVPGAYRLFANLLSLPKAKK